MDCIVHTYNRTFVFNCYSSSSGPISSSQLLSNTNNLVSWLSLLKTLVKPLAVSCTSSLPRPKIGLSDTAVMDMMISNLQQQRQVTEQLRREAAIKRISVSQAVQDIMKFISEHEQEDCLLVGFSSQKANPFREKSSCNLL